MLIFIIPGIIITGFLYYKRKEIKENYNDLQNLKKLVSTTEKNFILVNFISLKIIFQMYCDKLRKKFISHKPKLVDKNVYEIEYNLNDKIYKLVFKNKKGPTPILQIFTENEDVTEKILEYAGPEYNFHGHIFTPKFWGYKLLTFDLANGEEKSFSENESIILS
jgi:hypothetical protein